MWNYTREESDRTGYKPLPVGDYRVRVAKAEMAVSRNGNDMISLQFDVSGTNKKLFHHIVQLKDRMEITNRNLTQFYDSFADIPEGSFTLDAWVGKVGAVHVKHEEWNGETQARIAWFIPVAEQGDLPPWSEPDTVGGGDPNDFMKIPEGAQEDLPFL